MGGRDSDYPLGSGDEELARLELQGRLLSPATRMIFAQAGIRPGMRVLDLGCGAGDVVFVAADLVGPSGSVVGVDRSPQALGQARLRSEQRGLAQVRFVQGDVHDPVPGGPFDAIVGRLVLMYVPDPAAVLRRQATVLRAGGLVVPIEMDEATGRSLPATPLVSQAEAWLVEAFAKGGIPTVGPRLWAILEEAGLRPLGMIGIQPHFGPGDPDYVAELAGVIRTSAQLIERTGVATAEEIGVETFAQRVRDELQTYSAVGAYPMLLGAWATTNTGLR
jgi:SAM-dependent methyltransferase